jgi:hypothetical protein
MYIKHPTAVLLNQVSSSFSLDAFESGSFEGVKGDTRRLRIEPKEYSAIVEGPWKEKTKLRVEKGFLILDVMWRPADPEQAQKLGIENLPLVRQSIFLDVTPAGGLDMGMYKNGDLNRLREVFDLNADGQKWAFTDFIGKAARIKVEQKPNEKDPQNPFTNVTAVTKL